MGVAASVGDSTLERYVLLAFVDGDDQSCSNKLLEELLWPWPFAGFDQGGGGGGGGGEGVGDAYWDDVMIVARVDLDGDTESDASFLAARFGVSARLGSNSCPTILLLNRGDRLEQEQRLDPAAAKASFEPQHFVNAEAFSAFVWPRLKVTVRFENKSLWPLDMWWLDGTLGKSQGVLQIGEAYTASTFLTHVFIFRPTKVEGHSLTNESSLLWYTAKVQDDGQTIHIAPRCFETHGDCKRWRAEGFCDTTRPSWYVQQNPQFAPWVQQNCILSCGKTCLADTDRARRPSSTSRSSYHPDHWYHTMLGGHDHDHEEL